MNIWAHGRTRTPGAAPNGHHTSNFMGHLRDLQLDSEVLGGCLGQLTNCNWASCNPKELVQTCVITLIDWLTCCLVVWFMGWLVGRLNSPKHWGNVLRSSGCKRLGVRSNSTWIRNSRATRIHTHTQTLGKTSGVQWCNSVHCNSCKFSPNVSDVVVFEFYARILWTQPNNPRTVALSIW